MRKQRHLPEKSGKHTPDWLRQFKGYEHYTDEQAMAELHSLDLFAEILLGVTVRK